MQFLNFPKNLLFMFATTKVQFLKTQLNIN